MEFKTLLKWILCFFLEKKTDKIIVNYIVWLVLYCQWAALCISDIWRDYYIPQVKKPIMQLYEWSTREWVKMNIHICNSPTWNDILKNEIR